MSGRKENKGQKQVVIALATVALTVVSYQLYKKWTETIHQLPGANALNKELGNFGDMKKAGSLHQYLEELTNKYGSVGAFWWGAKRVGYITSQEVLLDDHNKKMLNQLSDRPPFLFDGFKPLIGKHSIQYVNGAEFKAKYHDIFLAAYQHNMITRIPIMVTLTQQTVNEWRHCLDRDLSDTKSAVIDATRCGFTYSSKSVIYSSFGENISEDTCRGIAEEYEHCWGEMERRLVDGIPSNAARDAKFEQSLNQMHNYIKSILKQSNDADKYSFLNYLSKRKDLYDSEEKILSDAVTSVIGGTHTTGSAIAWLFYYVARNVDIQEKMFKEIEKNFDLNVEIGDLDAKVVSDKVKRLMYCRQVITETLRISSLAPWSARVNYNEDMILNTCDGKGTKVKIPKGMALIIGQGVALKDKKVFQNPHTFDPDRWNRKNLKENRTALQSQDAMFGGLGGRMCPAWLFFRMETLVFIVGILSKFKFEMVSNQVVETKYGLVASPKQDIKIKATKR